MRQHHAVPGGTGVHGAQSAGRGAAPRGVRAAPSRHLHAAVQDGVRQQPGADVHGHGERDDAGRGTDNGGRESHHPRGAIAGPRVLWQGCPRVGQHQDLHGQEHDDGPGSIRLGAPEGGRDLRRGPAAGRVRAGLDEYLHRDVFAVGASGVRRRREARGGHVRARARAPPRGTLRQAGAHRGLRRLRRGRGASLRHRHEPGQLRGISPARASLRPRGHAGEPQRRARAVHVVRTR